MEVENNLDNQIDLAKMKRIHDSLISLFNEMSERLIERDQLVRLIGLTFFCKANCFLIGERGVAKSYAIENLGDSINNTKKLWQLMLKSDTKIEEVFGRTFQEPNGEWKINTKGSLLEADNIFADEMFKADGKVLSGLLELLVDRCYTYGDGEKKETNVMAFFGASNEYPTERFMLPYVDRFDLWVEIKPIQSKENRMRFYTDDYVRSPLTKKFISKEDIDFVYNEEANKIYVDKKIMQLYIEITTNFIGAQIKTSDRKYRRIIRLIKTMAYMNNREYVNYSDLFILLYSAWQNEVEKDRVERILFETIFGKKEEIKAFIYEIKDVFLGYMSEFNSQLFKFFNHKYDFFGENQESDYKIIIESFQFMILRFESLIKDIGVLENKYEFNQGVQQQLDENIIIIGLKEEVFSLDLLNSIETLKNDILEKKEAVIHWINENENIYKYKKNQKNNYV